MKSAMSSHSESIVVETGSGTNVFAAAETVLSLFSVNFGMFCRLHKEGTLACLSSSELFSGIRSARYIHQG
jgi:hypothetical protein